MDSSRAASKRPSSPQKQTSPVSVTGDFFTSPPPALVGTARKVAYCIAGANYLKEQSRSVINSGPEGPDSFAVDAVTAASCLIAPSKILHLATRKNAVELLGDAPFQLDDDYITFTKHGSGVRVTEHPRFDANSRLTQKNFDYTAEQLKWFETSAGGNSNEPKWVFDVAELGKGAKVGNWRMVQ